MEDTVMTDGNGNKMSIQGTDNMFTELEDLVPKTREERSKIVEPGARYAQDSMWRAAPIQEHIYPSQDLLGRKLRHPLHLQDPHAVTHKPNQYVDGSTDVGFKPQPSVIAYWVDQGTRKQDAQFFMENAFQNLDSDTLFGAEEKVYKDMLKAKHPDLDIR